MEKQIKLLKEQGFSQRKIAEKLKITRHQVRVHFGILSSDTKCKFCDKSLNKEKGQYKYCSLKCQQDYQRREKENLIEKEQNLPNGVGIRFLRNYLIRKLGNQCSICDITTWRGKPVPLVMDHEDGNPDNNELKNLRLVCCNCDAQLPTYKAKNTGNGRHYRRQRYAQGKSY